MSTTKQRQLQRDAITNNRYSSLDTWLEELKSRKHDLSKERNRSVERESPSIEDIFEKDIYKEKKIKIDIEEKSVEIKKKSSPFASRQGSSEFERVRYLHHQFPYMYHSSSPSYPYHFACPCKRCHASPCWMSRWVINIQKMNIKILTLKK